MVIVSRFLGSLLIIALSGCMATAQQTQPAQVFDLAEDADRAYSQGNCLASIDLYTRLIGTIEPEPIYYLRLGNCYARAGDLRQAIDSFEQAVVLNPNYPQAWTNLIRVRQRDLVVELERMMLALSSDDEISKAAVQEARETLRRLTGNGS